jgi:hypothetical protein
MGNPEVNLANCLQSRIIGNFLWPRGGSGAGQVTENPVSEALRYASHAPQWWDYFRIADIRRDAQSHPLCPGESGST